MYREQFLLKKKLLFWQARKFHQWWFRFDPPPSFNLIFYEQIFINFSLSRNYVRFSLTFGIRILHVDVSLHCDWKFLCIFEMYNMPYSNICLLRIVMQKTVCASKYLYILFCLLIFRGRGQSNIMCILRFCFVLTFFFSYFAKQYKQQSSKCFFLYVTSI